MDLFGPVGPGGGATLSGLHERTYTSLQNGTSLGHIAAGFIDTDLVFFTFLFYR